MIDPSNTVVGSTPTATDGRSGNSGASPAPVQVPQVLAGTAVPTPVPAPAPPIVQAAALRMTVEPTNNDMGYTYKFYDRATGELVLELPPDKAVKLGESADYAAGQFVSQTA